MILHFDQEHNYLLEEKNLIKTATGGIYHAHDIDLERNVAVKFVEVEGDSPRITESNLKKAYSEIRAMIQIGEDCNRIPRIYGQYYDEKEHILYIIMEWVKGATLTEHMKKAGQGQFLTWMIELCDILIVMEKKKIYHKDLKPDNVMINPRQEVILIDFNISIELPNLIEGTVNYKAPEMDSGSKYAGREKVDMFSIGAMLYEYYAGSVPVRGIDYAKNGRRGNLEWDEFTTAKEKNPKTPDRVDQIICKCMKMDTRDRYANIGQLKYELVGALREINRQSFNKKKNDRRNTEEKV